MRRSLCLVAAGLVLVAVLAGCRAERPSEAPSFEGETMERSMPEGAAPAAMAAQTMMAPDVAGQAKAAPSETLETLARSATERYLIRDATVTMEVKDSRKAVEAMSRAARSLGGYVGDTTEELDALNVRTITVQLRVPAGRFDDLMKAIEKEGTVLTRHVGIQDVTEEYVDVEAKLRNLKRTEERLLAHLSKSGKLADTLAVERELSRVRMEIEQYEGRMRFLKHSVQFSTVTVTCREKAKPGPVTPPESFSSGQVASDALRSLVGFVRGLWSWVIWAGVWTPVWLPVLLILLWRRRRRSPGRT